MKRGLIALLLMFVGISEAIQTRVQYVRYVEEKVNNAIFAHRVDIIDGVAQDRWLINGQKVSAEEYEEALLDSEKEERREERRRVEALKRREEEAEAQHQVFIHDARKDIARKRLELVIKNVESELLKVKEPKLEPYLVFDRQTVASADLFNQLQIDSLPEAKRLIALGHDVQEEDLSRTADQLEAFGPRLRDMFRLTVKQAINQCDDTRLLKELLEIVS
ncbi:hypothetical protein JW872_02495 [Candidatus Babeliales bacterium]|nr:hypothetical protein [Candidatus Babeliales bacterium]